MMLLLFVFLLQQFYLIASEEFCMEVRGKFRCREPFVSKTGRRGIRSIPPPDIRIFFMEADAGYEHYLDADDEIGFSKTNSSMNGTFLISGCIHEGGDVEPYLIAQNTTALPDGCHYSSSYVTNGLFKGFSYYDLSSDSIRQDSKMRPFRIITRKGRHRFYVLIDYCECEEPPVPSTTTTEATSLSGETYEDDSGSLTLIIIIIIILLMICLLLVVCIAGLMLGPF